MAKYVFSYHGGSAPADEAAGAAVMQAWMGWFETLGAAIIDGGNPTGQSKTVNGDGSVSNGGGSNPITGYSLVTATDIDAAVAMAKGCPILSGGGSVEVSEAHEM